MSKRKIRLSDTSPPTTRWVWRLNGTTYSKNSKRKVIAGPLSWALLYLDTALKLLLKASLAGAGHGVRISC